MSKHKQRVTILDGNANNGLNAGVTYWNLNNASGNLNRNIGSHLSLLISKVKRHRTLPLGKTQNKTLKGVSRIKIESSEVK
jgi:hypothetical protein